MSATMLEQMISFFFFFFLDVYFDHKEFIKANNE